MVATLNADIRKEEAKKTRKLGFIPGNIYGYKIDNNIGIKFKWNEIHNFLRSNTVGSKVKVKIEDKEFSCVVRDIQYDPTGSKPLHIDIYSTSGDKIEKARIPLVFRGQERLANKRLVLNIIIQEVQLKGKVKDLPEYIEIDVSTLGANDNIKAGDIALPENVEMLTDLNEVVATALEVDDSSDEAEEVSGTKESAV